MYIIIEMFYTFLPWTVLTVCLSFPMYVNCISHDTHMALALRKISRIHVRSCYISIMYVCYLLQTCVCVCVLVQCSISYGSRSLIIFSGSVCITASWRMEKGFSDNLRTCTIKLKGTRNGYTVFTQY